MLRLVWLATLFTFSRGDDVSCRESLADCKRDLNCSLALYSVFGKEECYTAIGYNPDTETVHRGMVLPCPLSCVNAIKALTSLPKGKVWENCKCVNRDPVCLTLKARLRRCIDSRRENYTIFSCTKAREHCNKDEKCDEAQKEFLQSCSLLISGVNCTQACKTAQDGLLSLELGKALNDCECDGMEEYYCRGIRAHYQALCKATRDPRDPNKLPTPAPTLQLSVRHSSGQALLGPLMWTFYSTIVANAFLVYIR